jgi:hypothetical protein
MHGISPPQRLKLCLELRNVMVLLVEAACVLAWLLKLCLQLHNVNRVSSNLKTSPNGSRANARRRNASNFEQLGR